jgi:hypothetical protein
MTRADQRQRLRADGVRGCADGCGETPDRYEEVAVGSRGSRTAVVALIIILAVLAMPLTALAEDSGLAPTDFGATAAETDAVPPTLTLPPDITAAATGPEGATVTYVATAADDEGNPIAVACSPASGSTFPLGQTSVTCSATDSSGSVVASGGFTVTVVPTFRGFYRPIDMDGMTNVVKGGATVPLKFQVFAGTTELTDPSSLPITIVQMWCGTQGQWAVPEEPVTRGGTSLRYDAGAHQFIYNWQAPKAAAGTFYRIVVQMPDGTTVEAVFKIASGNSRLPTPG